MDKRRALTRMLSLLLLAAWTASLLSGCAGSGEDARNTVYEDMREAFERSGLLSANIGIFSKTEKDGSVSYGECGSGVVFRKEGNSYYALTAAHVVSTVGAELLVFTVNTEMKSESIPGMDLDVLSGDTYDAMIPAEILYTGTRDDLAVIRFNTEEDLAAVAIAGADPVKDDRILCVGNPQNEWFRLSYGKILSGIERFGEAQGYPSNAMKHSAYIQVGSSGGAAFNEKMELAGITPGGYYTPADGSFLYGVMIPASEIGICLGEWDGR